MPDLIPFQFENWAIRVHIDGAGNPWWTVKDVCDVLGLTNPSETVKRLESDEYITLSFSDSGMPPSMLLVNEPGLYRLLFRSNKRKAQQFQHWVFHEVLPQIRKTGVYEIPAVEKMLTPAEMHLQQIELHKAQALLNIGFEQRLHAQEIRQAEHACQLEAQQRQLEAMTARVPPVGKMRPEEWLRRHTKPYLSRDLMAHLRASCTSREHPERWRPEGYDYAVPYFTSDVIAAAYEEITRQLSFLHDPGTLSARQRKRHTWTP